jgi:predicted CoA-binding protein
MDDSKAEAAIKILKTAKVILLIDWPDTGIPSSLLKAGFKVYSYAPDNYTEVVLEISGNGKEKLIFNEVNDQPSKIDIVYIFRPEEEYAEILAKHVLPLEAKTIWLQSPLLSIKNTLLAEWRGLRVIESIDIVAVAKQIACI